MKALMTMIAATAISANVALAAGKTHLVALHVDENDPAKMSLVLNNAENIDSDYRSQGDETKIEIVAYGPGLNMFVKGKSPVAQRIAAMALEHENFTFSACGNTLAKMEKKVGHKVPLISEATIVPSGAVRLIELQQQGYAYLRP